MQETNKKMENVWELMGDIDYQIKHNTHTSVKTHLIYANGDKVGIFLNHTYLLS